MDKKRRIRGIPLQLAQLGLARISYHPCFLPVSGRLPLHHYLRARRPTANAMAAQAKFVPGNGWAQSYGVHPTRWLGEVTDLEQYHQGWNASSTGGWSKSPFLGIGFTSPNQVSVGDKQISNSWVKHWDMNPNPCYN